MKKEPVSTGKVINVKIAGLGGMGILTAAGILAEAAFRAGRDCKRSELHGMSQRGGSVSSDVRFGKIVFSPMIPRGEIDYLLLMEESQLELFGHDLRAGGEIISAAIFKAAPLPNRKCLNIALLGALGARLDFPARTWTEVMREKLKPDLLEINAAAFNLGREAMNNYAAGKQK